MAPGTQFTAAQAQWSDAEDFILYPSGGWIENEMKKQTKEGFQMTGAPEPVVSSDSSLPWEALHSTAGEGYIVPSQGKNVAGGKEFMRAMLSKEAAVNFAKTKLSSTIVKGTVPEDGFGSTALVSQVKMLEGAGDNVFSWNFVDLYGINTGHAGAVEHLPPGRLECRRADQGPAGDHRQGRQGRLDQEGRGLVIMEAP